MSARTLTVGEKHILRHIRRDCGSDGWTTVSEAVMPLVRKLPPELCETSPTGARLTSDGDAIVDAMEWL